MNLSSWPNEWEEYKRTLGSAAPWMNHYCPAQVELHRLKNHYHGAISEQKRQEILRRILSELRYQLVNTRGWNQRNAWLKAEVHNYQAATYELAGDDREAERFYKEAIEVYAANVPGYWGLAQLLEKNGRLDEAGDALKMALRHVSSKSQMAPIKRALEDIARKRNEILPAPPEQVADDPSQ